MKCLPRTSTPAKKPYLQSTSGRFPVCSREGRNAEKSDSVDKFWKVGTWQSKATARSATKAKAERGGKELVLKADFIQYSDHMQL